MTEDHGHENCCNIGLLLVVPLHEVTVDLQGEEVQEEVGDVAVEERTGEDPPKLLVDVETREVLVLHAVERTIPGDLGLLLGVVVANQK